MTVVNDLVAATPHRDQFDNSPYASANCTPCSVANGASTVTAGRIHKTGGQVRSLVRRYEETNPATPGWSIPDAVLAAHRLGLTLINHSQDGWPAILAYLAAGYYVIAQGDSDQFGNSTCSGAFNGDHCIGIHPAKRVIGSGVFQHFINDPICPTGRWEYDDTLKRYVTKLDSRGRFAIFAQKVPAVRLMHGGQLTDPAPDHMLGKRGAPLPSRRIRPAPGVDYAPIGTVGVGSPFIAYQFSTGGDPIDGIRFWYGNLDGSRWVHTSGLAQKGGA